MNKVQVQSYLNYEVYQQLQTYMIEQGLSEATAIEAIVNSHFVHESQDVTERIAKIEQALSELKRHLIRIRFPHR